MFLQVVRYLLSGKTWQVRRRSVSSMIPLSWRRPYQRGMCMLIVLLFHWTLEEFSLTLKKFNIQEIIKFAKLVILVLHCQSLEILIGRPLNFIVSCIWSINDVQKVKNSKKSFPRLHMHLCYDSSVENCLIPVKGFWRYKRHPLAQLTVDRWAEQVKSLVRTFSVIRLLWWLIWQMIGSISTISYSCLDRKINQSSIYLSSLWEYWRHKPVMINAVSATPLPAGSNVNIRFLIGVL